MRIPGWLQDWLLSRADTIMSTHMPDFMVGGAKAPYLKRWWIIPRNRFFNIYLHHFLRSDDDRATHDHPWFNVSILLEGRYIEHARTWVPGPNFGGTTATVREDGDVVFRRPTSAHRVELFAKYHPYGGQFETYPVTTLFITGPVVREWGFHCPKRWVPWREFVDARDTGSVGKGCGD